MIRALDLPKAALTSLLWLLPAACGDDAAHPHDTASTAGDTATTVADTAAPDAVASACSADDRPACLYRPAATYPYTTTTVEGLTYTDISAATRNVNIAVYRPTGAPTPMPVVVLSHGGADGKTNPLKSMEHWAPVFAGAGYLTVAIAHEGRSDDSYDAVCDALGVDRDAHPCGIKIGWDRPHDVDRVLTWLTESAAGELAGIVDLTRIAHVGHSAGAGAALMSVGATRNYVCALPFGFVDEQQDCQVDDLVSLAKPTIDIAVALSPQGPDNDGFMEASFGAVTRPVLMATGAQDGSDGEPANRLLLWPLLPENGKFKLYVDDVGAQHTLFEGSTDACERQTTAPKCAAMRQAIFATALAFVDAYLRDDAAAAAWLAGDDVVTAGAGVLSLERR